MSGELKAISTALRLITRDCLFVGIHFVIALYITRTQNSTC